MTIMFRTNKREEMRLLTHKKIKICLFFLAIGLSQGTQEEDIECQEVKQITTEENLTLLWPPESQTDSPASLWYKPSNTTASKVSLKFGEYEWLAEYTRKLWKFTLKKTRTKMVETRLHTEMFSPQSWMRVTLSSQSGYHFEVKEQVIDVRLGDLEMDTINSVTISGAIATVSTNCINNKERQTTSLTTSLPETTTKTTTDLTTLTTTDPTTLTTTETTTLTTLLPTTVPDPTTISSDYESVTEEDIDEHNSTSNDLPVNAPSKEKLDGHDCANLPIWVWGCVAAMVLFLALSVVLLVFVILLHRRNKSLSASSYGGKHKDTLPGRLVSPGGYGQQSKDLQFFRPGNNDSIVAIAPQPSMASYTQTLDLPSGNQISPNVQFSTSPRPSEYKRSTSCPDRSPSLSFPPPPSTPPPERNETVPLFSPNGSADCENNRVSSHRERHSVRTSSRRKKHVKDCFDADDENSVDN
ncbi:uncharacterized protein [Palaemon carinicauda]|uniref:uncharacterized protein n=1 Tax=Palaemon carinicauda TaxID=392227 RepID=UPI0035B59B22